MGEQKGCDKQVKQKPPLFTVVNIVSWKGYDYCVLEKGA